MRLHRPEKGLLRNLINYAIYPDYSVAESYIS